MKTNYIRKALVSLFSSITPNVFYAQANSQVAFPYIVFELNLVAEENYGSYSLEVDVWDKGNNVNNLENICDSLEKLDRTLHTDENISFVMYFESKVIVEDSDKELKRRRLVYNLKLYSQEE